MAVNYAEGEAYSKNHQKKIPDSTTKWAVPIVGTNQIMMLADLSFPTVNSEVSDERWSSLNELQSFNLNGENFIATI